MNVITLPVKTGTELTGEDKQLHALLSKAVAAYRSSTMHPNSFIGKQKAASAMAYLDSIELILDKPGLKTELEYHLAVSIIDIAQLTRVARNYGDPNAA